MSSGANPAQPVYVVRALHELDRDIPLTLIDRLQSQEVPIRRGAAWARSKLIDEKLVPDNRAANALIKQGQADNLVVISVAYRFFIRLGDTKLETAEVAVDLFVRKAKLAKPARAASRVRPSPGGGKSTSRDFVRFKTTSAWLRRSRIRDWVRLVYMDTDANDPSPLYLHAPEVFRNEWDIRLKAAVPWTEAEAARRGVIKLRRPLADLPNEHQYTNLSRIPISVGCPQPCRLAVPPILPEPPRC